MAFSHKHVAPKMMSCDDPSPEVTVVSPVKRAREIVEGKRQEAKVPEKYSPRFRMDLRLGRWSWVGDLR